VQNKPHGTAGAGGIPTHRLAILSNRVLRAIAARYAKAINLTIPEWRG